MINAFARILLCSCVFGVLWINSFTYKLNDKLNVYRHTHADRYDQSERHNSSANMLKLEASANIKIHLYKIRDIQLNTEFKRHIGVGLHNVHVGV